MDSEKKEHKHIQVTLIWGGTGEHKKETVALEDTAGAVFETVYKRFEQKPSDQDTFEVNGHDFKRSEFGLRVEELVERFGRDLQFEVIPPTSGA